MSCRLLPYAKPRSRCSSKKKASRTAKRVLESAGPRTKNPASTFIPPQPPACVRYVTPVVAEWGVAGVVCSTAPHGACASYGGFFAAILCKMRQEKRIRRSTRSFAGKQTEASAVRQRVVRCSLARHTDEPQTKAWGGEDSSEGEGQAKQARGRAGRAPDSHV